MLTIDLSSIFNVRLLGRVRAIFFKLRFEVGPGDPLGQVGVAVMMPSDRWGLHFSGAADTVCAEP